MKIIKPGGARKERLVDQDYFLEIKVMSSDELSCRNILYGLYATHSGHDDAVRT